MSEVNIEIFPIARTVVDREAVRKWLDFLGAQEYDPPEGVTDPALLVALAAKRCYKSFVPGLNPNVTKVRENMVEYFDNILKSGHGSVLEHAVYSFAIENVSRVFTAEMNRHRAGWAISEGSMRFIRFSEDIPFWMPTSFKLDGTENEDLKRRKIVSQELIHLAFQSQREIYKELLEVWDMEEGNKNFHYKKTVTSALRRIIGQGVATGGVWSGNIRALRHVITLRSDPSAEEEIFHVFSRIGEYMVKSEPMLFQDFSEKGGSWAPSYRKV